MRRARRACWGVLFVMSTIYVLTKNGQQETYDENQIRDLLRRGILTGETFFWREGMPQWRPLQELHPGIVPVAPTMRAGDPSHEFPARALAADQSSPSKAPSAQPSYEDDDDLGHKLRFMHKVRFLRLVAISFDLFLVLVPQIVVLLFGWFMLTGEATDTQENFWFFTGVDTYFLGLVMTQVTQNLSGRSIGKSLFGLRVVDVETSMRRGFGANFARLATHGSFAVVPFCLMTEMSSHVLYGAIIYAVIDALPIFYDDRCLHDYLSGTKVVQRSLY